MDATGAIRVKLDVPASDALEAIGYERHADPTAMAATLRVPATFVRR